MLKSLATALGILAVSATLFAQDSLQVGYATMTPSNGGALPIASILFSYTNNNGVLVSQAAVGAASPMLSGVVFVDQSGAETGVALVNPANQTAAVTLILRNSFGIEAARNSQVIDANQHIARFVSEIFPNLPSNFAGSLTFESNSPLASVALRRTENVYREALYSSLPVLNANSPSSAPQLVFPHIAAGGGYTTQILLVNVTNQVMLGSCALVSSSGQPMSVDDGARSGFNYRIEPRGTFQVSLGNSGEVAAGYAVVSPDPGSPIPNGNAIFQYRSGGYPVTEASVDAIAPTTVSRLFVDNAGTETGVAIANPGTTNADLQITLLDRFGNVESQTNQVLPAGSHIARFARELFPAAVYDGFSGLMEIRSSVPVVEIALKLTINSRSDIILTTLPVADMTRAAPAGTLVFPHIVIGGGYSTRLLFVNGSPTVDSAGTLRFRQSSGAAMTIPLRGQTTDQFDFLIPAGGGRQLYPGNPNRVAVVSLLDPSTNQLTTELTINEGNSVRPRIRIADSGGSSRDDYDAVVQSSNTEVATIEASGKVTGKKAGFSSLAISAGGVVASATATISRVDSGGAGFGATGVAQDLARRLFIASTQEHTVLQAQDFRQVPAVYAGIARSPGFKNDRRLLSQFQNPAFLALNQAEGSIYVSDSANHVIRRVLPGASGNVVTLAGTGLPGGSDGTPLQSSFDNPQGIALDRRGNLWVADAGNHTIRLIDLSAGTVRTVAGVAGAAGATDGVGAQARFSSPMGIAIETESLARQLERERRGEAAPPVSVIVADTGNGLLRRVRENGQVETISTALPSPTPPAKEAAETTVRAATSALAPVKFSSPVALTVDPAGNIFVSESGSGSVRVLLGNGNVVAAVQKDSFRDPKGILAAVDGRILVVDSATSLQEIQYGAPQIANVTPDRVSKSGGERVTIHGTNFSPDTVVNVAGVLLSALQITDTQTISFVVPPLPSGRNILTIQNRGGIVQAPIVVSAVSLQSLKPGFITTVAGGSTFSGEGTPALTVPVAAEAVEVDSAGNVFLADTGNHRVRRIDGRTGIVTTVAGSGSAERFGDGRLATASGLNAPRALAFDTAGNLLIADFSVRKVDAISGILTTVAGGQYGFCGDGGPAIDACFNYVTGLALDAEGNMYISDRFNERIRRVDGKTNIITTIAGSGVEGFAGDGGPATAAATDSPFGLTVDNARKVLYFADLINRRIRRVNLTTGVIDTVAGGASYTEDRGNNGPATNAYLDYPFDVKVDTSGNLFISESARIRRVDIATGIITTYAGNEFARFGGDGGPATAASLSSETRGIVVDAAGNVFIADTGNTRVRKVDATTGIITTIAGNGVPSEVFDNDAAAAATLRDPTGVVKDAAGNLYITDSGNNRIRRVDAATGIITTVVGGGNPPSGIGDGGRAAQAILGGPRGRVAFDSYGNMFIADTYDYAVRRVDATTGIITTVVREEGLTPHRVVVDRNGNLYIADSEARKIFKFDASTGVLSRFAGGQTSGDIGDNGLAADAVFGEGLSLWMDANDDLIVTDVENGRVRRIDTTTTIITTIAGGGKTYEENQPALRSKILPVDAVTDSAGNLFLIDYDYPLGVRRVSAATGLINSVAGTGDVTPDLGDNGPALKASLDYPNSVYVDDAGNLFIADTDNQRIRVVRGPIP